MSLRWWGFLATLVAITGAASLQFVLTHLYPTTPAQVLLFVLLFITVAAATIPPAAYLNHRFAGRHWRRQDPRRLWRQAGEAGLLVVVLAYLQRLQALDWTMAAVLLGVFILMETFFLTRG
ncbi:MAG: hypothetical protein D6796_10190 [Caldilineae bacterium]|nr:MAG: hypothetical protein D6796_10190 [Caldilineae bacterium]